MGVAALLHPRWLFRNSITSISVGAFDDLGSLTALLIADNHITYFGALQTHALVSLSQLEVFPQRAPFTGCEVNLGVCPAVSDRCSSVATCASAFGVQSPCCSSMGACRACVANNAPLAPICFRCSEDCVITVTQSSPSANTCVSNGTCVTDGPGFYGTNERCTFRMITNATLSVAEWFVQTNDFMTINSTQYAGPNRPPDGVSMTAGSTFTWTTDGALDLWLGFTICASIPSTGCPVPATLPLPSARSSIPFNYTLTIDPDIGSLPARGSTDVGDPKNRDLTIGKAYAFRPPNGSSTEMGLATYLESAYGAISYSLNVTSLDPAAADEILVNTVTGYILVVPSRPYMASVELVATDSGGFPAPLRQWTFTTHHADTTLGDASGPGDTGCSNGAVKVDGVRYDSSYNCTCTAGFQGPNCRVRTDLPELLVRPWVFAPPNNGLVYQNITIGDGVQGARRLGRTQWAQGQTYRVAPLSGTTGYTAIDTSETLNLTYALRFRGGGSVPRGFFIEGASGELLVEIPSATATYEAFVEATAPGTRPVALYNITFNVLPADTTNATYGPNGRDCAGGTDQRADLVEFDHNYSCTCPTNTTEPNCDPVISTASAATGGSDGQAVTIVGAVAGGLVVLLLGVLALWRHRALKAQNQPVDMGAVQDEVLGGLGMAALTIKPSELGMAFTFSDSLAHAALATHDLGELGDSVGVDLLAELRSRQGLPTALATMLKAPSTTIAVYPAEAECVVVMKRTPGAKRSSDERFAAVLHKRITRRKTSLEQQYAVVAVDVAVPKRVPTELNRRNVLRLKTIGEGNFGVVFKATVSSSTVAVNITVAVKTLKAADANDRNQLLREAALMVRPCILTWRARERLVTVASSLNLQFAGTLRPSSCCADGGHCHSAPEHGELLFSLSPDDL